jgi:penicillin-binding protein 1A
LGEGANTALPVFALFMKKVYADATLGIKKGDFEPPAGGTTITLDCNQYQQGNAPNEQNPAKGGKNLDERLGF